MATATQSKSSGTNGQRAAGSKPSASRHRGGPKRAVDARARNQHGPAMPSWLTAAVSVVGVGVAVGAGLYATRRQWMSKAQEWRDEFSAAFADDETDYENFDQTRNAGADAMRDHPGDDWEDIDDMSDASFPASDPPSFNPGKA
jgi:hypothetical protein